MGVSLVIHPENPYVPTAHANVRFSLPKTIPRIYLVVRGGFDLTPFYPVDEDCVHFHRVAREAVEPFGAGYYSSTKQLVIRILSPSSR